MTKRKKKSIGELIMEYFKAYPKQDLKHGPVVDWVEGKYSILYGRKPRDTWRNIRKLHKDGFLIKIQKGVYRYEPDAVVQRELAVFTYTQ